MHLFYEIIVRQYITYYWSITALSQRQKQIATSPAVAASRCMFDLRHSPPGCHGDHLQTKRAATASNDRSHLALISVPVGTPPHCYGNWTTRLHSVTNRSVYQHSKHPNASPDHIHVAQKQASSFTTDMTVAPSDSVHNNINGWMYSTRIQVGEQNNRTIVFQQQVRCQGRLTFYLFSF